MSDIKLQNLINDGDNLFEKVSNESFFLFEKPIYELWLDRALNCVGRDKIGSTNPLKLYRPEMWPTRVSSEPSISYGGNTTVVYVKRNKSNPTYSMMDFSDLFERQINFLREIETKRPETESIPKSNPFLFYLSDRKVYRIFNGEKQLLKLGGVAYNILSCLQQNESNKFISSENLARYISSTARNVQTEILKIRAKIENSFEGILGTEFIDSDNLGYKLGEKIKLKEK